MSNNKQFGNLNSEEFTIIGADVKIKGTITSNSNIRIDGDIQGDIFSKREITIGEDAKVNGQINANNIIIGGIVYGTVKAIDKVILDSTSKLKGDIFCKNLVMEEGAKFDGNCKTGDSVETEKAPDIIKLQASISK